MTVLAHFGLPLLSATWGSRNIGPLNNSILQLNYGGGGGSRDPASFHVVMAENDAFPFRVKR
jgi:hypothetical protein